MSSLSCSHAARGGALTIPAHDHLALFARQKVRDAATNLRAALAVGGAPPDAVARWRRMLGALEPIVDAWRLEDGDGH